MKFIVDMNLTPRWVDLLVTRGYEAVHWSKVGNQNDADDVIMDYAAQNGFTILTNDLDFGEILASTQKSIPSVIQLRSSDVNPDVVGNHLLIGITQMQTALEKGALVTVDTTRHRVRCLPLGNDASSFKT
jgi:predicted nuclease of predicted toxin-antitoxin system